MAGSTRASPRVARNLDSCRVACAPHPQPG